MFFLMMLVVVSAKSGRVRQRESSNFIKNSDFKERLFSFIKKELRGRETYWLISSIMGESYWAE